MGMFSDSKIWLSLSWYIAKNYTGLGFRQIHTETSVLEHFLKNRLCSWVKVQAYNGTRIMNETKKWAAFVQFLKNMARTTSVWPNVT